MAKSFTDLVKSRRDKGGSVSGSISYGIKEKLKETFDPRRMINQKGLLPALFPGLRSYQAGGSKTGAQLNSSEMTTPSAAVLEPLLDSIRINTKISARNSMVLPMMHRDINVMRQNITKLVKLKGGTPTNKADMFFMKARDRNAAYGVQSAEETKTLTKPTEETDNSGFFSLLFKGIIDGIKGVGQAITNGFASLAASLPSILLNAMSIGSNLLTLLFSAFPGGWVKAFLMATTAAAALLVLLGVGDQRYIKQNKEFTDKSGAMGSALMGDEAVYAQVVGTPDEERKAYADQQKKQQDVLEKENAPFRVRVYHAGVPEFLSNIRDAAGKRKYSDEQIADITGYKLEDVQKTVATKLKEKKDALEPIVGPKAKMGREKFPEKAKEYDNIVSELGSYSPELLKSDTQKNMESEIKQKNETQTPAKKAEPVSDNSTTPKVEPVPKETGKTVEGRSKLYKMTMGMSKDANAEVNVSNNNNTVNKKNSTQTIPSAYDPVVTKKLSGASR